MFASVRCAEEPTVDVKFSLTFPRDALSVPVMRHVLGDALRGLGADDQGVSELLLAVTEACTNVVRHGGPGRGYQVVANLGKGGCRIEVVNSGRGGGPLHRVRLRRPAWQVAATGAAKGRRRDGRPATFGRSLLRSRRPPPKQLRGEEKTAAASDPSAAVSEGGRGLAIMRACVDDVTLRAGPERGTVVSLRKRIAWRPDTPFAQPPAGELADAG
jgi:serine/threonine-protein kinase RsbW